MDRHQCQALHCDALIRRDMLMCKRHWYMVPQAVQRLVWTNHRSNRRTEWIATIMQAVAYAAEAEGHLRQPMQILEAFYQTKEERLAWFTSPQKLLNGRFPIRMMRAPDGVQAVMAVLNQLADGAYL